MGPLEWLADHVLDGLIHAFNWTSDNMGLSGAVYTALGFGWLATNFVRGWWPDPRHRPRGARVVLLICAPVAATVAGLLRKVAGNGEERVEVKLRHRKPGVRPRKRVRPS